MKYVLPILAAALTLAAPAFGGKLSAPNSLKLCKTEIAKLNPPPIAFSMDEHQTRIDALHLDAVYKARTADGRRNRIYCKVDRIANTAALSFQYPQAPADALAQASTAPASPD